MKNLVRNLMIPSCLFAALVFSNVVTAQKILQVGAGEYFTSYRTTDGKLFATKWSGTTPAPYDVGLSNVVDVDGAQYTNIALTGTGEVYIVGTNGSVAFVTPVRTDYMGNEFTGNSKVYGWFKAYLTLKEGSIWMWGEDKLNINDSVPIPAPTPLVQPAGKTFIKLAVSTQGQASILALASDGTVWKYAGSATPVQLNFPGTARNITAVGAAAYIIETNTDLLACGYYGSYVGAPILSQNGPFVSIKALWQAAGCVFPAKEIVGNYNTLHIIDANNNMFASGSNVQGEIGNGIEFNPWRTRTNFAWLWNFTNGELLTGPVQIPGKFKNLNTSNTIAFYFFVQDMGNNWYSWGRNKALTLGNGITLSVNDYGTYPEGLNVPAPRLVTPLTQVWTVAPAFDPNAIPAPLANAGINQYINTSNTILYGEGSSQQEATIKGYLWTKVSGTGGTIISPISINTAVTGLSAGTYIFRLTVTNNLSVSDSRDVTVVVSSETTTAQDNHPPVAIAGPDQVITLPVSLVTLSGIGTDDDGTIIGYQWKQLSGSLSASINAPFSPIAIAVGLSQGIYKYELTVTDNDGATAKDTMQVTVNSILNIAPIANAGNDIVITLPVNTTTLVGNGTDTDGTINYYQWIKIGGPSTGSLINATSSTTTASSLSEGIYQYELTVTDNDGAIGKDTIQVTVNPAPNIAPVANAGNDIVITLPVNTTTLIGNGTDTDGTISSYQWIKIAGPSTGSLINATSSTTTAGSLSEGIYQYELTVTDDDGAIGKDTIQVTVNPEPNIAPIANAGADIIITLPINTTPLVGNGTDIDGTIGSYQWAKISGPPTGTIANSTSATATANNLVEGVYQYELDVTDNDGATGKDTIQVTVNTAVGKAIRVNLYNGTVAYSNTQWNNWKPVSATASYKLLYEDRSISTVTATLSAQPAFVDNATNYASAATMCPPEVLRINSVATFTRSLTVKGLDPLKRYNFELYASRANRGNSTVYKIGVKADTINTDYNINDFARFVNVSPDATGKLVVTISNIGRYQYLSGFTITESAGTINGLSVRSSTQEINTIETRVEVSGDHVKAYPNPFTSSIHIQLNDNDAGQYDLSLSDISGKLYWKKSINKTFGIFSEIINTINLQKGIYILSVNGNQKRSAVKLIKF